MFSFDSTSSPSFDQFEGERSPAQWRAYWQGLHQLLHVTQHLSAQVDLEALVDAIPQLARRVWDCKRALLYHFENRNDELLTTYVASEGNTIRCSLDDPLVGYAARHK